MKVFRMKHLYAQSQFVTKKIFIWQPLASLQHSSGIVNQDNNEGWTLVSNKKRRKSNSKNNQVAAGLGILLLIKDLLLLYLLMELRNLLQLIMLKTIL